MSPRRWGMPRPGVSRCTWPQAPSQVSSIAPAPVPRRTPLPYLPAAGGGPLLAGPPSSSCEGAAGCPAAQVVTGHRLEPAWPPSTSEALPGPANGAASRVQGKSRIPRPPRRAPTCCQGNPGVSSAAAFPGGRQPGPLRSRGRGETRGRLRRWGRGREEGCEGSAGSRCWQLPEPGRGGRGWKFNKQLFLRGVGGRGVLSLGRVQISPRFGHSKSLIY